MQDRRLSVYLSRKDTFCRMTAIGEKLPGACQDTPWAAFHVALAVKIRLAMCLIFAESESDLVGHAFIIFVETAVGDLAGAHT